MATPTATRPQRAPLPLLRECQPLPSRCMARDRELDALTDVIARLEHDIAVAEGHLKHCAPRSPRAGKLRSQLQGKRLHLDKYREREAELLTEDGSYTADPDDDRDADAFALSPLASL